MTIFTTPHLLDGHRWRGMRIGLLGGSFNPPHSGHLHISELARRALGLDCVWWLVTTQNPLKLHSVTASLDVRVGLCRTLTRDHPRILVTTLEQSLNTQRTWPTIRALKTYFPKTDFVFLCGADLAGELHHWYRWNRIPEECALAFVIRPPATDMVCNHPIRRIIRQNHSINQGQPNAPLAPGMAYWITSEPMNFMSSTQLRNINKSNS